MLRTVSLLIALSAYAGLAAAECGAAHEAKQATTNEQAQAPAKASAAKTARESSHKSVKVVACEGNNCDAAHAKQEVKRDTKSSPQG